MLRPIDPSTSRGFLRGLFLLAKAHPWLAPECRSWPTDPTARQMKDSFHGLFRKWATGTITAADRRSLALASDVLIPSPLDN